MHEVLSKDKGAEILRISAPLSYTSATMVITHYGGQCFKLSFGDTSLAFNPISKKSKLTESTLCTDCVFILMCDPDFNGAEHMKHGTK